MFIEVDNMEIKNKHVAVALDKNGKCEFLAKVKVIDDRELNRLINEKEQHKAQREQEELELKNQVLDNQEKIRKLECKVDERDLLLAKSIYDNFVDRGLIENDDAFQQAWYDYFMNDIDLVIEQYPAEFSKILDKVRGW